MKISMDGVAVLSLLACGIISSVSAAHAHHRDLLGRVLHKRKVSSSSSSTSNGTDWIDASPETATRVVSCTDQSCSRPRATTFVHITKTITPTIVKTLALPANYAEVNAIPTRRRAPRPLTESTLEEHPMNIERLIENQVDNPADFLDSANSSQNEPVQEEENTLEPSPEPPAMRHLELRSPKNSIQALKPRQDQGYQNFELGGNTGPTSTISAAKAGTSSLCPAANDTQYESEASIPYQIVCNIDFEGNDYPFQKVESYEGCVQKCDAYNFINHHVLCIAALYVPSRGDDADNCYLKSSVSNPTKSTLDIYGAIRLSDVEGSLSSSIVAADSSTSVAPKPTSSSAKSPGDIRSSSADDDKQTSSAADPATSSPPEGSQPGITYAAGDNIIEPKVSESHFLGPSVNTPTKQYIDYTAPKSPDLKSSLLTVGVNGDLTTGYDLSLQTGVLSINSSTHSLLATLDGPPHISRDGGQGGYVNGQHLFIFCDTGSYTTTTGSTEGKFLGFVSSSVAVDKGMNGLDRNALNLQDGIGEWSDDVGRKGQRYAVWPESSVIGLDATTGVLFAPIVYDEVDLNTKDAKFTYTGATLLTITADNKAGPVAERPVAKIWDQDEVGWGCAGGIRSWGTSGIGGKDGSVYVFGNNEGGILLGRTSPADLADRDSYTFWNGKEWTKDMPTTSSKNFFIEGAFMDIDLFYSPRHLTFIIVYMTKYADNIFYFRYLKADNGILPPFAPGAKSDSDYVENILKFDWSEEQELYKAPKSLSGKYVYGGAVHVGYYGSDDITNGGSKMLLSWTAPTGENPAAVKSEYEIIMAEVDWA
ncbi:uncharacterized protein KY384_001212 [Bacidia gigantensis]|uniref:uncharacterized protein n=1 Tax=Bacidia gigantensis TaxID=2732470 RepID=UPI001D03B4DF|nr:uncharacterized protein KY384_001212 [Bacidia gigantensis]KAG8534367.1 hypothetical protein KY384_001212 [Bacidia gigantensis]